MSMDRKEIKKVAIATAESAQTLIDKVGERDKRIKELEAQVGYLQPLTTSEGHPIGANLWSAVINKGIKAEKQLEQVREAFVYGNATQTHMNMVSIFKPALIKEISDG